MTASFKRINRLVKQDSGAREYLLYIQNVRRYSSHTVVAYRTDLSQFAKHCQKELLSASRGDVKTFLSLLRSRDYSFASINRKLEVLRSFYRFHRRFSDYKQFPCSFIIPLRYAKPKINYLTADQIKTTLTKIKPGTNQEKARDKLVLEILYGTGCRASELINLTKANVDLEKLQIRVIGKSQIERMVPISSRIRKLIQKHLKYSNDKSTSQYLLTTNSGKKMYSMFLWRLIRKYFTKLDVEINVSAHTFRHSFATHLYHNRAPIKAIRDLLGHRSLMSTSAYLHLDIKILTKIYQKAHPRS